MRRILQSCALWLMAELVDAKVHNIIIIIIRSYCITHERLAIMVNTKQTRWINIISVEFSVYNIHIILYID